MDKVPWKRILGFTLLPLISAIAPIAVLPVLVRAVGPDGWAAVAVGMSIGMGASVFVNYSWGILGPSRVAKAVGDDIARIYRTSFFMRLPLWLVSAPILFILAERLGGANDGAAGLMAIALSFGGLSPAWYFIGIGKPFRIAVWDTFPRIASSLISIPLLLAFPFGMTYALVTLLTTVGASVLASIVILRPVRGLGSWADERQSIRQYFRMQSALTGSGLVSNLYTGFSVAIVGAVSFPAVAVFAAADRIRAMAKQGTMAVGNGLQGWVAEPKVWPEQRRRMIIALGIMTFLGVFVGATVAIGLPAIGPILFGDKITIDHWTSIFAGLALLFTAVSLSTSFHVLAPLAKANTISIATILGAVIGAPSIILGTVSMGASGGMLGIAIAEGVVLSVQLFAVIRILRNKTSER